MFNTPSHDARLVRDARDPDAGRRLGSLGRPTTGAGAAAAVFGAVAVVAVFARLLSEQVSTEPQDPDEPRRW